MQFLILGYDGKDEQAPERRAAARPDHLALAEKMKGEGKLLYAAAILDESGAMSGSMMVCEFADRKHVDDWFAHEPYVVGKVWQKIEVSDCKVAPIFAAVKA